MMRLFSCTVSLIYTAADRKASAAAVIADTTDFLVESQTSRSSGTVGKQGETE